MAHLQSNRSYQASTSSGEAYCFPKAAYAEHAVEHLVTVPLKQGQYDALVSSLITRVPASSNRLPSTLLKMLNAGNYAGAADQFPEWVYGGGKKPAGLVTRRESERVMFVG